MNRFASLLIGIALAFAAVQASAFAGDAQDEKAKIQQLQAQAEEKEAKGYYASAAKLYHKVGKRQTEHRLKAQAYLKEADCLFEAGKTFNATKAYKELMKEYALYVPFERVVGNLRKLAEDFVDGKGTLFGVRDKSEAIDTYFFILTEAPSIAVSLSDRLRLAELLVKISGIDHHGLAGLPAHFRQFRQRAGMQERLASRKGNARNERVGYDPVE